MVKPNDIILAINKLIVERYPKDTVYVNLLPEGFGRPSTLIELVEVGRADANRSTLSVTVGIDITCFVKVDGHYQSDVEKLLGRQNEVMDLFACGYLEVAGRSLTVSAVEGDMTFLSSSVGLVFDYFDERPEPAGTEEAPLMETVETNIKLED
jgi:hypothetical protein